MIDIKPFIGMVWFQKIVKQFRWPKTNAYKFKLLFFCNEPRWLWIFILHFILTPTVIKADTVTIQKNFGKLNCSPLVEIFEQKNATNYLKWQDAIKEKFVRNQKQGLNFGFSKSVFWLRYSVTNCNAEPIFIYSAVHNQFLDYLDFFVLKGDSFLQEIHMGARVENIKEVPVFLNQNESRTILIRIQSGTPIRIPITLYNHTFLDKYKMSKGFYNGVYYGILIFLLIILIFVFIKLKDVMHLYFGLGLVALVIFSLGIDNFLPQIVLFSKPEFLLHFTTLMSSLLLLFYAMFTEKFFDLKNEYKKITLLFKIIKIYAILHLLFFIINYYAANKLMFITGPVVSLLLVGTSVYLWLWQGRDHIKLYTIATFTFLVGVIFHLLSNIGALSFEGFSFYALKTGYLIQAIIFTMALVERYIMFQRHFTKVLEEKVEERTTDIENLNIILRLRNQELSNANSQLQNYQQNLEAIVLKRNEEILHVNNSLETIISSAQLAIFDIDINNCVLSVWNSAAERIFGWKQNEVISKPLPFINTENANEHTEIIGQLLAGESIPYLELSRNKRNGASITIRLSLTPVYKDNKFERAIVIADDITERKRLRDEIQTSELKFRTLFQGSRFGIVINNPEFLILDINPYIMEMTGYSYDEIICHNVLEFVPNAWHDQIKLRIKKLYENFEIPYEEFEIICKDGRHLFVEGKSSLIYISNEPYVFTFMLDVTERKNIDRKLFETILETEENERRRFAGDLHDELGPQLATMRIYAASLRKRITDLEQLKLVDELLDLIKTSITNVREISSKLSPHLLENYGIVTAINNEVELKQAFFKISFSNNIEKYRFDTNIEIIIYRIIKELLNNTLKYAKAKNVYIIIFHEKELILIEYSDDGVGFNYQKLMLGERKGLGLLNIQSRVKSVNGFCSFESKEGSGFKFILRVPAELKNVTPNA